MKKQHKEDIARSMEVPVEMAELVPELVIDLWALGSSLSKFIEIVKPLGLPPGSRLLDLGCGKGAVSITLAEEFGFRARGVDLCMPFIENAKNQAKAHGVADLCEFEQGELHDELNRSKGYDLVIMASLGGVLGTADEAVGSMRKAARPGGFIALDDGFVKPGGQNDRHHYRHLRSCEETRRLLTAHGDRIAAELFYSDDETRAINEEYLEAMRRRQLEVTVRYPHIAEAVASFIAEQEFEVEYIAANITGALWLIQCDTDAEVGLQIRPTQ